tara:strand:+ start:805 stop:1308 length:504 start_codon:yes stop_codon:yes gene_type:complete
MCDIQSALAVAGTIQSYREQKVQNKAIRRDQETTRRNADKGYLHDMTKIDREKVNADREKRIAEIESKKERDGEIAQSLNLGFGNSTKIVQSIGALFDNDWNTITRDYSKDVTTLQDQQSEAYANQQKTYNSLKPPIDPSRTGLYIQVASQGYEGYQRNQTNKNAKK